MQGPSSSSSINATTLGGFWPTLRFRSTIFYLYDSMHGPTNPKYLASLVSSYFLSLLSKYSVSAFLSDNFNAMYFLHIDRRSFIPTQIKIHLNFSKSALLLGSDFNCARFCVRIRFCRLWYIVLCVCISVCL